MNISEEIRNDIKKSQDSLKKVEKIAKKTKSKNDLKSETDKNVDILNYYNSLSERDKYAFNQELKKKKIRESYSQYLKYVYGDNYVLTKFHRFLANVCETVVKRLENGKSTLVCLSVPPQHGKSITVTETLPSWFLGRNPDKRCICTGYNADMAEKFGDKNREKVKKYGKDLFDISISDSQDNKTLFNLKDHLGGMLSAGILGGLTGNPSALTIIDDPFKNGIEAKNQTIRDNIWQVFIDSIWTRQRGLGNAIIIIHTRWHDDDLIGRVIKNIPEALVINIPCVADENDRYLHRKIGETLCPELGFDANWVEKTRKLLGKATFNALYQGKPYVEGGNIVKRQDIMFYSKNTCPEDFEEYVLSCDLSFGTVNKNSDPYCMTLWGRNGGNHYLLKILDKKASFTETNRTLRVLCSEYPKLKKKIIEAKANGNATIELLGKEIGGFVPFDPKGESKEARFNAVSPYFEAHNVWFPDESVEPDIEKYIETVLKFPNITHEDFVDTISQYLLNYEYKYGGRIETDSRFKVLARAIRGR